VKFLQVERQGHVLAQLEERRVVELEDRDGVLLVGVARPELDVLERLVAQRDFFDGFVAEHLRGGVAQLPVPAFDHVPHPDPDPLDRETEVGDGLEGAGLHRVHDAGPAEDEDRLRPSGSGGRLGPLGQRVDLGDRVVEQFLRDALGGGTVQVAVQEVDLEGADLLDGGEAEFDQPGLSAAGRRVDEPLFGRHVDSPDH
jgi:hypothetical protein